MDRAVTVLCFVAGLWLTGPSQVLCADVSQLLPLFDRVGEPLFMPKGEKNQVYDVPEDWMSDRYRRAGPVVTLRFGGNTRIPVRKIALPDFQLPMSLSKRANFSPYLPRHREMAARLVSILLGMRNLDDFLSAAVYAQTHVNPNLFIYALSIAMLHRNDTQGAPFPSAAEMFPGKYCDGDTVAQAREEATTVPDPAKREAIDMPLDYTANDIEPEHKLAYFREDVGVNLFHWNWHLVYPSAGELRIVNKDRRGELWYHVHEQIQARYNFERFSNGMMRVTRLLNLRDPIPEGYFPKLDKSNAARTWPPRAANTVLSDVNRKADDLKFDLQDLERWRDQIHEAIRSGIYVTESSQRKNLTVEDGIDVLGNMLEASLLSPNKLLYGDLHIFGHIALGVSHDPDGRHLEPFGVIGDLATSMRDPIFYRWHAFVDDIFQRHKETLPPYTDGELSFPNVNVTGVVVKTAGSNRPNVFATFLQKSALDLSRGLDFAPPGRVFAKVTHLNHRPFTYHITVTNTASRPLEGYVRIYLAPKNDERGYEMLLKEQRLFFIELDKFYVTLQPGKNNIERQSTMSSVTIPFGRTFRSLDDNRPANNDSVRLDQFNFCRCGWPHHMLIPKGNPTGMEAKLFVMITDYSKDKVEGPTGMCNEAPSYCGILGQKYPDKRPMGFPFDRPVSSQNALLKSFLTSNMFSEDVVIKFDKSTPVDLAPKAAEQSQFM